MDADMEKTFRRLDQACGLAEQELALLSDKDFPGLEDAAARRRKIVLELAEDIRGLAGSPGDEALLEKLRRLESLQGRLTSEALRLRESLRQDLNNLRSQSKRFFAYQGAARPSGLVRNRFLNKKS